MFSELFPWFSFNLHSFISRFHHASLSAELSELESGRESKSYKSELKSGRKTEERKSWNEWRGLSDKIGDNRRRGEARSGVMRR